MKKFLSIILLTILVVCLYNNVAFADKIDTLITGMKDVNQITSQNSKVSQIFSTALKLIRIIGSGVSLIVVTMLGIKYMIASANEKADLKKQAIPIIIGCVLLFAGSNIAVIIAEFGQELN